MADEPGPSRLLKVPESVAAALEAKLQGTGFSSLDEFVAFVLSRLAESTADVPFTPEEEARLKERLRSLGYID
jgi:hypothetical protein